MSETTTRPVFGDPDAIANMTVPDPEEELGRIEEELDALHNRYDEIDNQIAELHHEQSRIEESIGNREDLLFELRKDPRPVEACADFHVDGAHWHCGSCPWESDADHDSARFRAERHAHESGHTVYLMQIGDVPGFDEPIADIAA